MPVSVNIINVIHQQDASNMKSSCMKSKLIYRLPKLFAEIIVSLDDQTLASKNVSIQTGFISVIMELFSSMQSWIKNHFSND